MQVGDNVLVEYRGSTCRGEITNYYYPQYEVTLYGSGKVVMAYADELTVDN